MLLEDIDADLIVISYEHSTKENIHQTMIAITLNYARQLIRFFTFPFSKSLLINKSTLTEAIE
ncbi:hypothetical protein O9G_000501 [Rozella allomycis CSF55]|uniref:Uncharacterized protein n=1 Tax=Rozella allomycis (strain CSF55) TaxID=988480 RepID=A0A075B0I8_ROZAC|nr:hypothetical protein O9G_000501 [Rozella allomycis CSF55]|eukprot:EPZ34314.1 hypothetical protein O9G_000501 [Rozella allomycis CSF55]